jgi:hypothetical protein
MERQSQGESSETLADASTEAVAVFHDVQHFRDAIDDLLMNGFTHASLSVLANERTIAAKLGRTYKSTTELEDDPDVPRAEYVEDESIGDVQGGIIAAATYLPAVIGSVAVTVSGGTILAAIAAAAVAGGAGAGAGALLASLVGREHTKHLEEHVNHGGLLLWVRTPDREHELLATGILARHGGEHVHLHTLPPPRRIKSIPTRRPLLSFGPAS